MSDREFDNYLTLLAGLLRLGRGQREQIAKELRAHLDDRLEELLAEGVSREEAIERALAEFGDAAGLAGEFASIARGRNRRWLMRVTTFSVAATILIAAGLITFWPGRNAGPGVAAVVAQNAEQKQEQAAAAETTSEATAKSRPVEEALNKRADFSFVEMPLRDVIDGVGKQIGIQFVLDFRRLEEAGVSADTPVTWNLKGVRARTFLDFLLSDFELAYFERDDEMVVVITTPERVESMMHIRVYDCRDLFAIPWPGSFSARVPREGAQSAFSGATISAADDDQTPREVLPQIGEGALEPAVGAGAIESKPQRRSELADYDNRVVKLTDLITTNVYPDSWSDMGGPGTISEYAGLIVVTQTHECHKTVERVLSMLRQAAGLEQPAGGGVVR